QRQFAQAPGLPFAEVLDRQQVQQALDQESLSFRQRLFSPLVTLWVFLAQVLDPDHSCRQAVARFLAWRTGQGLPPASADTGAYCTPPSARDPAGPPDPRHGPPPTGPGPRRLALARPHPEGRGWI